MRNLSLELAKALLGAFLLAGHVFASAKAVSFSESLTTTHCLFIEQLELADLGGNKLPEFEWLAKLSGQCLMWRHKERSSEPHQTLAA